MTRDIFDIPFGTLDVIVSVLLIKLGLPTYLGPTEANTPDQIAADNAARFIEHFGDRRIEAIREVRYATGLGLKDSKDLVMQVYETYQNSWHFASQAIEELQDGRYEKAQGLIDKAIEARDKVLW